MSNGDGDGDDDNVQNAQLIRTGEGAGVRELATFTEVEDRLSFKIIPVISSGGQEWRMNVYHQGVQGPVVQTTSGLTDEQAEDLGISRRVQDRMNSALEFAKEELEIPRGLRGQSRAKRSLDALEDHGWNP